MFCSSISFAWWFLVPAAARGFLYVARFGVGVGTTAVSAVAANAKLLKVAEITIGSVAMLPIIDHFFFSEDPKVNANGKVNTQTVVLLKPTNQRQNPDPKKFDDPAPNEKDVTPKSSYTVDKESTQLAPSTYPNIVTENGVGISKYYQAGSFGTSANQDKRFKIIEAFDTSLNSNRCPSSSISQQQLGADFQYAWCGSVNSVYYAVGFQIKDRNCTSGYSNDNGTCKLTDTNLVIKPENKVPCEILKNIDGAFSADQKNPECLKNLKLKVTPNSVTLTHDPQTYDQLVSNPDGTLMQNFT